MSQMSSDDELMQDSAEDLSAGEGKLQTQSFA